MKKYIFSREKCIEDSLQNMELGLSKEELENTEWLKDCEGQSCTHAKGDVFLCLGKFLVDRDWLEEIEVEDKSPLGRYIFSKDLFIKYVAEKETYPSESIAENLDWITRCEGQEFKYDETGELRWNGYRAIDEWCKVL